MTLSTGARLGPYEILAPLGAGGMGEVYRAKDPRLGRDVAIKILPVSFSRDAERLRRFEQEARAAGVLNHPNITAVYDTGTHEGAPYVVSELLEGETLGTALAGGLTPRQGVDYGIQIAHGLSAAHEKGIIHRDLKPENLFVTRDGRVKILDFGLAKLLQEEPRDISASQGPTVAPPTEPGVVLGTVGYMSPEQIRGQAADARSDIFSLGVVLYEMLSGRRAFGKETAVQTMNAILTEDPPDLSSERPVSPAVERIVRRCLEKKPERRFRSAADLAFALDAVSAGSGSAPAFPSSTARTRRLPPAALIFFAVAVAVATAAGGFLWGRKKGLQDARPASFRPLTFRRGQTIPARFSPDGKTVFYSASWEGAPFEVFSTGTEHPGMRSLGLPPARLVAVSSTGELAVRLLARAGAPATLARVPAEGGSPRPILDDATEADWAPDGGSLAVVRGTTGNWRVEYPIGRKLFSSQTPIRSLRVSPQGDRVAFVHLSAGGPSGGFLRVADRTGRVETLSREWPTILSLAWRPDGQEVWFSAGAAMELPALRAVSLKGKERLIARVPGTLFLQDISRDGRVVVGMSVFRQAIAGRGPGETSEHDLSWFDGSLPTDLSADGRTLLFDETQTTRIESSVYLRATDGSPAIKLADGRALALSPDGRMVLAASSSRLMLLPTGPGEPRPVAVAPITHFEMARWLPDGKRFLLEGHETGRPFRLYLCDLAGGKPVELGPPLEGWPVVSPDGASFVFRNVGEDVVARRGFDGSSPRPVSAAMPRENLAGWSADGKSLFIYRSTEIPVRVFRLDLATGQRTLWKTIAPSDPAGVNGIFPLLMSGDGESYVYGYRRILTDLYAVEGWK